MIDHSGAKFFKINENYCRKMSKSYLVNGHDKNKVLVQSMKPYIEIENELFEVVICLISW